MSDGINEGVVLLVPPDLPDHENRVQHDSGDDETEEQNAQHQQDARAPVQRDPAHGQRRGECYYAGAEGREEELASLASAFEHQPQCKGIGGIHLGSFGFGFDPGAYLRHFEVTDNAHHLERSQLNPSDIEFVPGKAMAGRGRMRVVIVVPAFTKG